MDRIQKTFAQQKNLLNIFLTAGYPSLESLPKLASQLFTSGVDIIEVGMPYSDPLADGPVIQKTSANALKNGITISTIFKQVKAIRQSEASAPIFLMGYLNQLLQFGPEKFLSNCKEVGVDGLIIPDLPFEIYLKDYKTLFEEYGIAISFLITPGTSEERIRALDKACSSFLYVVSDNSITGGGKGVFSESQLYYFNRIKDLNLTSPTMIGFGISSKNMLKQASQYANGAIIGTAYLEAVEQGTSSEFITQLTR